MTHCPDDTRLSRELLCRKFERFCNPGRLIEDEDHSVGSGQDVATGLTSVPGLAVDHFGRLYVLENTTGNPGPSPVLGGRASVGLRLPLPTRPRQIARGEPPSVEMIMCPSCRWESDVGAGSANNLTPRPSRPGAESAFQLLKRRCFCRKMCRRPMPRWHFVVVPSNVLPRLGLKSNIRK